MVISAPRSGSAWCANWLTTGNRLCLHDPLWDFHYADLDGLDFGAREMGVACTGIAMWPDWVNRHPAPKVVLHRPAREVNAALERVGLHHAPTELFHNLDHIAGLHVDWRALFQQPKPIHEFLFAEPFDAQRHQLLRNMSVTSIYGRRIQSVAVMEALLKERRLGTPDRPSP